MAPLPVMMLVLALQLVGMAHARDRADPIQPSNAAVQPSNTSFNRQHRGLRAAVASQTVVSGQRGYPDYPNLVGRLAFPYKQSYLDHFPDKLDTDRKMTPDGPGYKCDGCKPPRPQWATAAYNGGVLPYPVAHVDPGVVDAP